MFLVLWWLYLINTETWNCPEESFKCLHGTPKCIPQTRLCDKIIHCQDGSDEHQCGKYFLYVKRAEYSCICIMISLIKEYVVAISHSTVTWLHHHHTLKNTGVILIAPTWSWETRVLLSIWQFSLLTWNGMRFAHARMTYLRSEMEVGRMLHSLASSVAKKSRIPFTLHQISYGSGEK